MKSENYTDVLEFLLLGLSQDPELQPFLFGVFLSMYLITVLGNLFIILAVSSDSHLHIPMYFFLSILSFVDISFTSTIVPKMLLNILTGNKAITYTGCLTQGYFFLVLMCMDGLLLTVMAYDRYVAICLPLHYMVIMNPHLCGLLILLSCVISIMNALLHSLMVLHLSFCTDLKIPHFFCELAQIVKLACSDTLINNILVYIVASLLGVGPLSVIIFSYVCIISSVLRIPSTGGKYKAFSTCGSHLFAVSLFYGTSVGVYLSSAAHLSPSSSAVSSVLYTVVTPMMNPFIYSLRNKDIKGALKKTISAITYFL
ncbi:PREDICTED: olfactory receptor 7G3-like [Chrysochloris asiatica]|uniref:Olfactory receptor n=1 Tax=Chrysochloris asiatica TaxID=185453 RepID=A0A9B0U923_CHRAS|nr:PREDICTED: olfactory receptor 7G3-like [Chrysochloris asiatica]